MSEAPSLKAGLLPQPADNGLPFRYYRVGEHGARAYQRLADISDGKVHAELEADFIVGVRQLAHWEEQPFGLSSKNVWIALQDLEPLKTSSFHGTQVTGDLSAIAWVYRDQVPIFKAPNAGASGDTLRRLSELRILEETQRGSSTWLRMGPHAWVRGSDLRRPSKGPLPVGLRAQERWIDVDLQAQVLTAYQGETPVFATLVSTGKGAPDSPLATPKGEHRIWVKLRTTDMTNLEDEEAQRYYAILDVPWVMYFNAGYGLHAAFWHNSFGNVRSHGCVNLAPLDAERLFHWAMPRLPAGWTAVLPTPYDQGTRVVVR